MRTGDWKMAELADLYYERWPKQELNFRDVNEATKFKKVKGFGKQLVQNIAVTTKLDQLGARERRAKAQVTGQSERLTQLELKRDEQEQALRSGQRSKEEADVATDTALTNSSPSIDKIRQFNRQRRKAEVNIEKCRESIKKTETKLNDTQALQERTCKRLTRYEDEKDKLQRNAKILAHDVELDGIFNALKVGLTLLATFVLRKMLGNARLKPVTFLERIAYLPARQHFEGEYEHIIFEYNTRDTDIMALLGAHCKTINSMNLRMRSGYTLRVGVLPPRLKSSNTS
jgi:hypothetical protein